MPDSPSSPATFTITSAGSQSVVFAIPAGTWVSGLWESIGTCLNSHSDNIRFPPSDPLLSFGSKPSGAFDSTAVATALQMTHINAAAGGNVTFSYLTNIPAPGVDVTSLVLHLTGATGRRRTVTAFI